MMDWMWGMMWLGMLVVVLLSLALVVGGVYLLARAVRGDGHRTPDERPPSAPTSQARAILEERYARGEIDREEFDERRRTLGL